MFANRITFLSIYGSRWLHRRIQFIEGEVPRIDPIERRAIIALIEVEGSIPYDYLTYALGRRLATERVTGFFEHAYRAGR